MITTPSPSRVAFWLTALAAVATVAATVPTFFVRDLLLGPAVMNGSARGTALIMLVGGVPLLVAALALDRRGWSMALVLRLGVLAYLAYNGVMLLFATPFNRLFLLYVLAMSSTVFALGTTLARVDASLVAQRLPRAPARIIGGYILTIVVLNTLLWLRTIVPATFATDPTSFLDGTGIATNPVFVQDLVFWLPSAALIGLLMWSRRPWGTLLAGGYLVYGVLESIGVATDQWLGASADPGSTVAAMAAVVIFVVLAAVGIGALAFYLRSMREVSESRTSSAPAATG